MSKELKAGDMVRLTGWSGAAIHNWPMKFPYIANYLGNDENGNNLLKSKQGEYWMLSWFTYEIIESETHQQLAPTITTSSTVLQVEHDTLQNMASANGVKPFLNSSGHFQAGFSLPNGYTWLIVWCELPPINVTIHDGEVGAIIHDQI